MKKIVSLLLAIVMLLGTTVALSSCNKKGAEIKVYLGDQLYDLDPALAFVNDDLTRVLSLIYEPLFTLNQKGKVVNALAKSYKIIEDEEKDLYQMEITLRETYWNDGKNKVTADDVFFAWSRILDPNFQTQAAPLLYDIKNAVAVKNDECSRSDLGIEANRDVLTITFEGKIDYDAFLRNLTSVALVPVRENKADGTYQDFWAQKSSFIATIGPFAIRTWNMDTGVFTLQKNQYFRSEEGDGSYVYPALVTAKWTDENFQNYSDGNDRNINKFLKSKLESFIESAVFCMGVLPASKDYREYYADDVKSYDSFSTYSYIFNTEKELFADEDVRKALSMVIDREYLASQLVFAKAADGLIAPSVWESVKKKVSFRSQSESLIATTAKLAEAQELLADKDLPTTEFVLVVRNSPDDLLIATYAVEQWAKLGFEVSINAVTMDKEVWASSDEGGRVASFGDDSKVTVYDDGIQAMYMAGDFDVLGVDYQMYSTNAFTALCGFTTTMNGNGVKNGFDAVTGQSTRTPVLHCSGFSDEAYDALMQRAYEEKDLDKRAAILHEAEAYLMEKLPIMPIVYNENYYIIDGVSGVDVDGYGNLVFTEAKAPIVKEEAANKNENED
ncbi:MAG: hypothetical protein J6S44_02075 [Clostridia bacterium]|nr:hypothetical protein [Clostridia bacterium]